MTLWLKQSTAAVVSFGPFLDKTDGVTEETGLVSALDHATTGIKLSKNGGALTIRHATVTATTYDAYGMYRVTLDTTDTGTLGTLRMAFNEAATCLPVWQDFMVLPANIYDSLVSGSDLIDVGSVTGLTASNLDATISSRLASASYTAPPSAAANASQVRTELTTELARIDVATSTRLASASYTAPLDAAGIRTAVGLATANLDTQLAADLAQATLARKILKNRTETNPATGVMTIYDDDGTTPLYTANLYTDVAGATPYAGTAAVNRRNALA